MRLDTSTDPQVGYRPAGSLAFATALQPYTGPFTRRHAAHLLRRAAFGGTAREVDALTALGAQAAVSALFNPAEPEVAFPDYPDTDELYDRKQRRLAAQNWWIDRMLRTKRPLQEKMTLFWHGHFATSINKVPPVLMVEQIDLLRRLGLGDFRALLSAVSKNPAMLVWLDNRSNSKLHPNENYAREVMELFALGLGNYSEDDVHSAARAFTGWTLDRELAYVYRPGLHDAGPKTFLGRSGNLTGDDVLATIVAQPIHQRFICRKLLEYFVYSDPEPELIEALAATYAVTGYDIARTAGTVFRSNVFYSTRAYRALPKSPIDFTIGLLRFMEVAGAPKETVYWMRRMGQEPLAPPSVKGWDGGPAWINTATLLARFNYVNRVVKVAAAGGAQAMTAGYPAYTPDAIVQQAGGLDARRVLDTIVGDAIEDDVTSDVRLALARYLDSSDASLPTPFGSENYQEKIRGALALVLNLPANQLN